MFKVITQFNRNNERPLPINTVIVMGEFFSCGNHIDKTANLCDFYYCSEYLHMSTTLIELCLKNINLEKNNAVTDDDKDSIKVYLNELNSNIPATLIALLVANELDELLAYANQLTNIELEPSLIELAQVFRGHENELSHLVGSSYYKTRMAVAQTGIDTLLDILVKDADEDVRVAVARQARDCDLDILVDDDEPCVRIQVALTARDKDLDILRTDKSARVRAAVAKVGRICDLDHLVNDGSFRVVKAVVEHNHIQHLRRLCKSSSYGVKSLLIRNNIPEILHLLSDNSDIDIRRAACTALEKIYKQERA